MSTRYKDRSLTALDPVILYYQPAFFCDFTPTDPSCQPKPPPPKGEQTSPDAKPAVSQSEQADKTPNRPTLTPAVRIWIRHPAELNYKAEKASSIALDRTPSWAAANGRPSSDIVVDDHTHNHGNTTMGPSFPQAYGSGGMYLSYNAVMKAIDCDGEMGRKQFPADLTMWVHCSPPVSGEDAELARYHGFYGQQLDKEKCPHLWVVWHPGTWYSDQCNLPQGKQWRPPQKLWIADTVIYPPHKELADKSYIKDAAPAQCIYLEQDYATYVANLDVPKQPAGSGLALLDAGPLTATSMTPHPRLNVISKYAPGEIQKIKEIVSKAKIIDTRDDYLEVDEGETLVDALSRYMARFAKSKPYPKFYYLDIIGHSRSRDKILKIGEFALTSRAARAQFEELEDRDIMAALGIKAIRLLGCRTASHARGQRAVRAIREETEREVYASRSDLFAVHFESGGFREEARSLLADHDVIMNFGPGDMPPRDDYPAPSPGDDDDDDETPDGNGTYAGTPEIPPPSRFSIDALSDANAASVSADNYLFWNWKPSQFGALLEMTFVEWMERDNRLRRANYEVLTPVSVPPRSISDLRSFDLFLYEERPRIRVNHGDASYAFFFKQSGRPLWKSLCKIGITVDVDPPRPT
jgi:hypothetical protein